MQLLDQPATVEWVDGMSKQPNGKLVPNGKSKYFDSVRHALQFTMETLREGCREIAVIHTDGITLRRDDIKAMYAKIK